MVLVFQKEAKWVFFLCYEKTKNATCEGVNKMNQVLQVLPNHRKQRIAWKGVAWKHSAPLMCMHTISVRYESLR